MMRLFTIVAVILALSNVAMAQINFDEMSVASTDYGVAAYEGRPHTMAAYNNKIYFILHDSTSGPGAVYEYDPQDGLLNGTNHATLFSSAGSIYAMRTMGEDLYAADDLGNVFVYDGTTVSTMAGTPFNSSDFARSMVQVGEQQYFGTRNGNIYRHDNGTWENVYSAPTIREITDMTYWSHDGSLHASVHSPDLSAQGQLLSSSTGDNGSWQPSLTGFFGASPLIDGGDTLYAAVLNSAYSYSSSVRRSTDGENFEVISQSSGQYKLAWGGLYHDDIAYFFHNLYGPDFGYRVVDDNGTVSLVANQNWCIAQAVELNGEIYALAFDSSNPPEQFPLADTFESDVYLLTTVPEPATMSLLALGGLTMLRRRKK